LNTYYFNKFYVSHMPGKTSRNKTKVYKSFWIGIGDYNFRKLNALSQFHYDICPPIIKAKSTFSFHCSIQLIAEDFKQDINKKMSNDADNIRFKKPNINFKNTKQVLKSLEPSVSMKDVIELMVGSFKIRQKRNIKLKTNFSID